eukprot:5098967-Pyramimonas_sp.AAC.1
MAEKAEYSMESVRGEEEEREAARRPCGGAVSSRVYANGTPSSLCSLGRRGRRQKAIVRSRSRSGFCPGPKRPLIHSRCRRAAAKFRAPSSAAPSAAPGR